jgi:hypothetical protein
MVHFLMAEELDDGYGRLDDAACHFKRPVSQTMGTSCEDTVPREDVVYKRPGFTKEVEFTKQRSVSCKAKSAAYIGRLTEMFWGQRLCTR